MEPADLTQPIVLDGAYMVFRIETAEDIEAAERQLAALKANILADRIGIVATQRAAPAWVEMKAALDAMDDGEGPYCVWAFDSGDVREKKQALWSEFLDWAKSHLGQGYSLSCVDGGLADPVTHWSFKGFLAGHGMQR